jgi:hypothetical protein
MTMLAALEFVLIGHHEDAASETDDIDMPAVEPRQHRTGDDVVDRPQRSLAVPEIEDAIERTEQWIELVCAEQNRDTAL